jgi:hypothetical protein
MRPVSRRAFVVAAGAVMAGAGCRLQRAALAPRTFLLQAPREEPPGAAKGEGVLVVRPFRVAAAFDSRAFVIRRGEAEYEVDAYDAFLLSPGPMLAEAMAGWIRSLGAFVSVTTGGSQVDPTHALEGQVMELYGDYRDPTRPTARLGLELRLLHPLVGSASRVQWQRSVHKAVPIVERRPEALVAGWNQGLAEICFELGSDLFTRPAGVESEG